METREFTRRNPGGTPMILPLTLTYADAAIERVKLPAHIWRCGATVIVERQLRGTMVTVEIDAAHNLPDVKRSNNRWPRTP